MKFFALLFAVSFVSAELPTVRLDGNRIIKGEDANAGEFPYMVSLRTYGVQPGHVCGGSILTDTWVLTAGHCCEVMKPREQFYVYAGSIYLDEGGSDHPIARVIRHERFNPMDKLDNDICVIQVHTPFKFSKNVAQVTLGPQDWSINPGDNVTVSGWGHTIPRGDGQADIPNRLQKGVNFKAISHSQCYQITGLMPYPGHLCVMGRIRGQTTWTGDSGGPLTKNGAQVGITSFSFLDYSYNLPAVYARTTFYVNWIKEKLGPDAKKLKFVK